MRFRYRLTIFLTAFGAATLGLLFVATMMSAEVADAAQERLNTITLLGVGGAAVAALLVSSVLAAPMKRRVDAILAVARRYALGDLQRPSPDHQDDEIGAIARAMDGAVRELGRRVDEL